MMIGKHVHFILNGAVVFGTVIAQDGFTLTVKGPGGQEYGRFIHTVTPIDRVV